MRLRVPRGALLVSPISSTVYCVLGGIGADLDGLFVYGVALTLVAGVEASDGRLEGEGGGGKRVVGYIPRR